ncbi:MAG TPA: HAMP domain-containing sensor histidine kinase [Gemmatimonadales bacterium]|nr:HAMP domain-containing sensor histidine kinase [Gemmatimonadales bacterium]
MRSESIRRLAPGVIIGLAVVLIGLTVGTGLVVTQHLQDDALNISRLYSGVFAGLNDPTPGAEAGALLQLGERVRKQGLPLVVTDGMGQVTAAANLPFAAALDDPRVKAYAMELDRVNAPLVEAGLGTVHYGPMPARRQLGLLALLQTLTVAVMVAVAFSAYRHAMASQRDRLWVAMAREAAHQMGTPLMSLQGWIEVVRSRPTPPADLAEHLGADAERLERVAQRFERIGNPARREPIGLGALADRVAGYYRPRLPRHANPIELRVEAAGAGPTVLGDPILLEWALESLVKNAIDALRGRSGTIILRVESEGRQGVLRVIDDGPGIEGSIRRTLFQPGISTKTGGWGIGLALATRVAQEAHQGSLSLEPSPTGACFRLSLPLHDEAAA